MTARIRTLSRAAPRSGGRRAGLRLLVVFLLAELTLLATSVLMLVLFTVADRTLLAGAWPLLAVLVVPTLLAALVAVAGVALLGDGPRTTRVRRELAIRWSWRDLGIGAAIGAGGLLLTIPAATIWAAWVGSDRANSALGETFAGRHLDPVAAAAMFLIVWLVAPIAEEVLFRGVLWRALEHWRWNRWLIFATTSMVFSLAHLEPLRTPLLLILSIPIGLARMVTGNLLASIAAHQVNNFLPAVALLLATTGSLPA
jgi:membrane protease YdiL (CAAX protease family)